MVIIVVNQWERSLYQSEGEDAPPFKLCQAHSGEKRDHRKISPKLRTEKPIKVLLEDTFSTDSVLPKNSIQAGLGSSRLKPTVKQPNESITNLSNFVAVQEHKTHTVDVANFRISRLPINTFGDGSVHLGFDFAHRVGFVWFLLILQATPPLTGGRCASSVTGRLGIDGRQKLRYLILLQLNNNLGVLVCLTVT